MGSINKRIKVQAAHTKMRNLSEKLKRAGSMTQVVQCLASKAKVLSSNPSTAKK
jgi:hypothetical protein